MGGMPIQVGKHNKRGGGQHHVMVIVRGMHGGLGKVGTATPDTNQNAAIGIGSMQTAVVVPDNLHLQAHLPPRHAPYLHEIVPQRQTQQSGQNLLTPVAKTSFHGALVFHLDPGLRTQARGRRFRH